MLRYSTLRLTLIFFLPSPQWPGFQYSFGDVRMRAALGTPNGNGLAWLVGQHQAEIGKKIVDRVHIFNCGSQFGDAWCLYFHLRAF